MHRAPRSRVVRAIAASAQAAAIAVVVVQAAPACSSDSSFTPTPQVAGAYSVNVTNQQNGCNFANWTPGSQSQNIPFQITQNGSALTGDVTGLVGVGMDLWMGTHEFTGSLVGQSASLTAYGKNSQNQGNCTFTTNATANVTFSGDTVQGAITYTKQTNNNPDCASIQGCQSVQQLSGARPPPNG
jgi:hypothetical protein